MPRLNSLHLNSVGMGSFTFHRIMKIETGPTVHYPYPRRLESLTIYRLMSLQRQHLIPPQLFFCNCVKKPEKVRTSRGFEPCSSYMIHFLYHLIVDSFLTGTLEPTNDQLPTTVAS